MLILQRHSYTAIVIAPLIYKTVFVKDSLYVCFVKLSWRLHCISQKTNPKRLGIQPLRRGMQHKVRFDVGITSVYTRGTGPKFSHSRRERALVCFSLPILYLQTELRLGHLLSEDRSFQSQTRQRTAGIETDRYLSNLPTRQEVGQGRILRGAIPQAQAKIRLTWYRD